MHCIFFIYKDKKGGVKTMQITADGILQYVLVAAGGFLVKVFLD
jgi:hypothetical protein